MSRFVKAKTDVLTLPNGDTLIVKRRLNEGEDTLMYRRMKGDRTRVAICHVVASLIDWNLKDDQPPIMGLSDDDKEAVLNNLDPDDFAEIRDAIYTHKDKVQRERDEEKKAQRGEVASSATSPLLGTTAGDTSGSTNSTQTSTQ